MYDVDTFFPLKNLLTIKISLMNPFGQNWTVCQFDPKFFTTFLHQGLAVVVNLWSICTFKSPTDVKLFNLLTTQP